MSQVWFHLIATTYGSWLPGDPRGFRTWQHREHVDGDYRHPPTVNYEARLERSRQLLKSQPTMLTTDERAIIGNALLRQFQLDGGRVLAIAVAGQHVHIQVRLDGGNARLPLGRAKLSAWHALKANGTTAKLWDKGSRVVRIGDRDHQRNVYRYILRHRNEGAWVWSALVRESPEGS